MESDFFLNGYRKNEMQRFVVFLLICCYLFEKRVEAAASFKFETSSLCPNNKKLAATIVTLNSFNIKGKFCVFADIDAKETFLGPIMVKGGVLVA